MGVFNNLKKKNGLIYGPTQNEKTDNVMQAAIETAGSNPQISQQKKKVEADAAKYQAENPSSPVIGEGTYTVKVGDSSYSRQGSRVPKNAAFGESKAAKNSPLTQAQTFDPDIDYSEFLNQGMASGASVEELMPYWNARQQKIASDPALSQYMYDDTYKNWMKYTGADTDIASRIYAAMASGASAQEIEMLLQERNYKISQNPNLSQYAYDDVYKAAMNYINSKEQPYNSDYDGRINSLMKDINNQKFEYNFEDDPLYQSYLEQARQQGHMAMEDTLASAATAAGGMNSYAIAAAQGIQNNYLQKVNDVIPELYQLAYNKYLNDQNQKMNVLDMYLGLDDRDYGRWQSERDYNDSRADLVYDRNKAQEQKDYNAGWDDKKWNYQLEQDEAAAAEAEKQEAYNKGLLYIQSDKLPPADVIEASGYSEKEWELIRNAYFSNFNSGSGGGDVSYTVDYKNPGNDGNNETGGMVPVQGYGYVSSDELVEMIENNEVDYYEVDGETVYYIKDNTAGRSRLIWQ